MKVWAGFVVLGFAAFLGTRLMPTSQSGMVRVSDAEAATLYGGSCVGKAMDYCGQTKPCITTYCDQESGSGNYKNSYTTKNCTGTGCGSVREYNTTGCS